MNYEFRLRIKGILPKNFQKKRALGSLIGLRIIVSCNTREFIILT